MGRTYRTAQGKSLDLEKLKLQNEMTPAIGNMRINARGDQLGAGGEVVKRREEMLDQHYQRNIVKNRKGAEPDHIPTRSGKANDIEPMVTQTLDRIQADEISLDEIAEQPQTEQVTSKPSNEYEVTGDTEESVTVDPVQPVNQTTGVAKGEKAIKGGLARAIAKTKDYENKKNKPKRI